MINQHRGAAAGRRQLQQRVSSVEKVEVEATGLKRRGQGRCSSVRAAEGISIVSWVSSNPNWDVTQSIREEKSNTTQGTRKRLG